MPCERRDLLRAAASVGAAALAGCAGATHPPFDRSDSGPSASPTIRVPDESLVGEPVRIRLDGFEPKTRVAVEATATDARGAEFSAEWSRRTDAKGRASVSAVETGRAISGNRTTSGSEQARTPKQPRNSPRFSVMGPGLDTPDPSGIEMLLQQLRPQGKSSTSKSATPKSPTPSNFVVEQNSVDVTLTARSNGDQPASATTTRVVADPAVSRQTIETSNLVGWLYAPPGDGPHPGVLALHGSEAVVPHELSRSLATHGYATLALQYFGADGLPASLDGVPLEYFRRATRWLTDRDDVRDGPVGFVGVSRGVEAALLSAAAFDGRSAVVGYSGGGVIGPGINQSATAVEGWEAAWTRDGAPIVDADPVRSVFSAVQAVRYDCEGTDCVSAIRDRVPAETLRRALAPVEAIDGPVLLLAGANDDNWPSSALAALAIDRLDRRGHDAPYQLRTYDGAGHVFGLPYRSYAGDVTGPEYGGSPAANAFAAANSWPLVLRYLRAGLGHNRP